MTSEANVVVSTPTLILLGLVIAVSVVIVVLTILRWRPDWVTTTPAEAMSAEIVKLQGQIQLLLAQLVAAESRAKQAEAKNHESEIKIVQLNEQLRIIRDQLEAKKLIAPVPETKHLCVLGIWTTEPGFDPQANENALAEAGVEYTALIGADASMEAISYAIRLRPYTTLEVGAGGDATGINLADGLATVQWWIDLANDYPKLANFLFLSDSSGSQVQTSFADRVFAEPTVQNVISLNKPVDDVVARRFARRLYAALGEGADFATAVRAARLAVGPQNAKLFRHRAKETGGD